MLKFILLVPLALFCAVSSWGQEKSVQIFEQLQFGALDVQNLLLQFPELSEINIAKKLVVQDEQAITLKLYAQDSSDVYLIHKNENGISAQKTISPFEVSKKFFSGTIRGTLYDTVLADTGSEKIAAQLSAAFQNDLPSTKGLRVEAFYSFEVISYFDNGELIKFGDVVKASLNVGRALAERFLRQDIHTLAWSLEEASADANERPFYTPVKASRISSLFNLARIHPVKRRIQPHNGVDLVAKSGTPVFPALEGEIIAMGRTRAKGKFILIQHDNGHQTTYDHLRAFKKGLKVGSRVELHSSIGEVGKTGLASGAHLHFGIIKDGLYVNPLPLLKDYTYAQKDIFESQDDLEDQEELDLFAR